MFCSQCGQQVPEGANFCSACGAPIATSAAPEAGGDATTSALEVGAFDPQHEVESLPELEPGTGMLVVVRGPNAGSRFLLDRERTSIGRHPESDIFLDDVTVSRRHAIVGRAERRELATGDELQVGRFKLLFIGDPALALGETS